MKGIEEGNKKMTASISGMQNELQGQINEFTQNMVTLHQSNQYISATVGTMNRSLETLAAQVSEAVSSIQNKLSNKIGYISGELHATEERMEQMVKQSRGGAPPPHMTSPDTNHISMQITQTNQS